MKFWNDTALRRYGVTVERRRCLSTRHNIFKKSLYRMKMRKQDAERALGKRKVSLGESGSFVRGKSGFPLGKVQRAKTGWKTGFLGTWRRLRNYFTFVYIITQKSQKSRECFALRRVSHGYLHGEQLIKRAGRWCVSSSPWRTIPPTTTRGSFKILNLKLSHQKKNKSRPIGRDLLCRYYINYSSVMAEKVSFS